MLAARAIKHRGRWARLVAPQAMAQLASTPEGCPGPATAAMAAKSGSTLDFESLGIAVADGLAAPDVVISTSGAALAPDGEFDAVEARRTGQASDLQGLAVSHDRV